MKITQNPAVIQALHSYHQNRATPAKKADEANQVQDKMDLSLKAMEFQAALKALKNVPDIRQERVDEVKGKMAEGKMATPEEVAAKMMSEINLKSRF